ncbi:MAG: hypothetical protein JNL58_03030 [Planctomyces sp.]|nr:hypothetical protein [Planctomyces sp.]
MLPTNASGIVTTIAGSGQDGFSGASGKAIDLPISQPFGLCIGPDGQLYVCSVGSHVVYRINIETGDMTIVAGCGRKGYSGDGGPAIAAELNEPYEVRFDKSGNLYFVEMQNHLVRKVDMTTGLISTLAGTGTQGFDGDGGPAVQGLMNRPHSIAFDAAGNLYICDIGNHRIRRVDMTNGIISTFAGTGERQPTPDGAPISGTPLDGPRALDFDGHGAFYLALREGNAIFRINLMAGTLHHLAGTGKSGYEGDGGPAKNAVLAGPKGIAFDSTGDLYFADTESHTIRVIRRESGVIETVIGDGVQGNGPPGAARQCRLDRPHGVFVSTDGVLYIGDSNNHQVRRLKLR